MCQRVNIEEKKNNTLQFNQKEYDNITTSNKLILVYVYLLHTYITINMYFNIRGITNIQTYHYVMASRLWIIEKKKVSCSVK